MIVTLISILLSLLYIVIRLLAGKVVDAALVPVVYWSAALSILELFALSAVVFPGPLIILLFLGLAWIMSQWIGLVALATGNEKMKEDYDKFIKKFYPMAILEKLSKPIYDAFVYTIDKIKQAWFSLTDLFKMIWNQIITVLGLVVTLGGAVDEDLAPPLPGKFLTSQMIKDGQFWKYKGKETIYWSEDKDTLSKNKIFNNKTKYNKFRESYGLSKDTTLKDVKIIQTLASLIKFSF